MKKFLITAAGFGALGCAALGLAGTAAAAGGADVTVNNLQAEGYSVQLDATPTANLSQCAVNSISHESLTGPNPTAYVDIVCPDGC